MINVAVFCTVLLVGITLLIGVLVLIYQHYRYRRKSMDWGDIGRYDTPLEIAPGSNNSSFRSYKYSQLVWKPDGHRDTGAKKQSNTHLHPTQRQCHSLLDIEKEQKRGGTRSSTKSCPPEVHLFAVPTQEFRLEKEQQQFVQPYYYYRQVIHPSVGKARRSLPEVVPNGSNSDRRSPKRHLLNQYHLNQSHVSKKRKNPPSTFSKHKLSIDYCIEHVPPIPITLGFGQVTRNLGIRQSPNNQFEHHDFLVDNSRRNEGFTRIEVEETGAQRYPNETREANPNYFIGHPFLHNSTETTASFNFNYADQQCSQRRLPHISPTLQTRQPHIPSPERLQKLSPDNSQLSHHTSATVSTMLTHQSRSLPTGPPVAGTRLNRTYSISSQGHIETAVRKGHRGSSPAIRTYGPDGTSFDVSSSPESPPPIYHGSRSPSPLYVRAASLDINRCGSSLGETNFHVSTQHSSHSMDSYPAGKAPLLSPNSLCARRASRCLSPLFIPPKSPTDGNSSSSQPSASSIGPMSPLLGSLQLELYTKKDVTIYLDAHQRITNLENQSNETGKKAETKGSFSFPLVPALPTFNGKKNGGSLGRLRFRLEYDLDKSDLILHVIEALDLTKGDKGGFNDPYVRVFVSPEIDNRKRETTTHRNEPNPFFDEHFKFSISQDDLKEKNLLLQILDRDKYSRKDVVGEVKLSLEDFDITTNLEVWAEIIQNKTPSGEKSEILISLSYLPSAERLTVVLLKARNLRPPHNKDSTDPFVKVYLLGKGRRQKKKKTSARKNSNNPTWNEAFTFSVPSGSLSNCSIEGWEKHGRIERGHRNDLLDVFHKYATIEWNGHSFMKSEDFITKYFGLMDTEDHDETTIKLMAGVIDTSKDGFISFPEFVDFEGLLTAPDALYFIAFRLFDTNGNGKVSFEEFERVINHTTLQKMIPFDMNGKFVRMYFGRRKNRVVAYNEFSQFLHDFHEEYATEAFRRFDKNLSGFISVEDFVKIMTNIRRHLLTPQVAEKLEQAALEMSQGAHVVSYPLFVAFNSLLNRMELMKRVCFQASNGYQNTKVTKEEFLHAGQMLRQITPFQVEILFKLAELINESTTLSMSDFKNIAPEEYYINVENRVLDIKAVSCPVFESAPAYPFDLVKTRMQNLRPNKLIQGRVYLTNLDCFLRVKHIEGIKGLYRGLSIHVISTCLGKAFKLSMNDWIRDRLSNRKGQVQYLRYEMFAGACAGACSSVVVNPLEIIKVRMQSLGQLFPHSKLSVTEVIRRTGLRGMYQGMTACLLRDVPFSAIFFPTYAHMKLYLQDENGYNSPMSLLFSGAAATIPAVPLSMPFDVVKTRLQAIPKPGEVTYTGTWDACVRIYKEEGWRPFMQGTRVIKPTQVGLALLVYEVLQRWFYVDFAGTRPTGSERRVQIMSVDQKKSDHPDHIGGYALALPIFAGIETKFGLVFPKFKNQKVKPLI